MNSEIFHGIGSTKDKMEANPNLEMRLTICQGIEKLLALYYMIRQEGKHCPNHSSYIFTKK